MIRRKRRSYSAEEKLDAVQLVRSSGKSVDRVARGLDLTPSAVRSWLKQATIDEGGDPDGVLTTRKLRRENRQRLGDFQMPTLAACGETPVRLSAGICGVWWGRCRRGRCPTGGLRTGAAGRRKPPRPKGSAAWAHLRHAAPSMMSTGALASRGTSPSRTAHPCASLPWDGARTQPRGSFTTGC